MYLRKIYPELEEHLEKKQVTVITGLRRVGKSTALKHLYEKYSSNNKLYLDLERVENRNIFIKDSYKKIEDEIEAMGFDFSKPGLIALDEIQTVKNIPSIIKSIYDSFGTKFVVTGSSSYYLKNHFTESLAGRKKIIDMYPLDFEEFLIFKKEKKENFEKFSWKTINPTFFRLYQTLYEEYLMYGGFPEVVLAKKSKDKIDYLKDILNSHIELDIKLLGDLSASDSLYKLILLLANRVGSKMDIAKISTILGENRNKIKEYILLLESTYLIKSIKPFTKGMDKEITKSPKLYFGDTGLLNICGQVSSGSLFENAVCLQLIPIGEVNYYERSSGTEIDFIFNRDAAIEVKETPIPQDVTTLKFRADKLDIKNQYIIGRNLAPKDFNNYIWGGNLSK